MQNRSERSREERPTTAAKIGSVAAALMLAVAQGATAQVVRTIDPIVVTATRVAERAFDLPVAIDSINAAQIQQDQLQINLSESLSRVPGIVVQNRWNYAQDLQVSSRGFGSRASFGVRGIRLYQDGIPATMPDGQGQIVGGSYGTSNSIAKLGGVVGRFNYALAANHFQTDGYRDHSHASREQANLKLKFDLGEDTKLAVIGNSLYQPEAQDPLGLSRAQWQANPRQVDPSALQFNTRKTVNQQQGGATLEQRLFGDTVLRVTGYGGGRTVRQFLALAGTLATSSGGVTDLDRDFGGIDARVTTRFALAGQPLSATIGAAYDRQHERRRGYVNNNGELGDLRRDEDDTVSNRDAYAQLEWSPSAAASLLAGVRHSEVRFDSIGAALYGGQPPRGNRATHRPMDAARVCSRQ